MKKILVANRGEIAVRIIKACKELGIKTVAIYSEADKESLHIMLADEAYQIGESQPAKSYLNMNSIIQLAQLTKCDAVHPGYGFLSENIVFRQLCESENLGYIVPSLENLTIMGNKLKAKEIAEQVKVPVVPGSRTSIQNVEELQEVLKNMDLPVILKASSGGGGKGIKICNTKKEALEQFASINNEAKNCFGEEGIYIENYIPRFKHIEVQILGDMYGNCMHFGERICSIQRNMQKLIEETPAPLLENDLREEMCQAAVKIAKTIGYVGVGTVEFIYDYINKKYYFMEMNTRIQVEHPVTEMVFGLDLVKEQIKIAEGKKIDRIQKDIRSIGHAIECRINAEDPKMGFLPSIGDIQLFIPPYGSPNVRVDTYIYSGYKVVPFYDSMLGKIIVWGEDRDDAIRKMEVALGSTTIVGIKTTIPFLESILNTAEFAAGVYDNTFVEKYRSKNA